MFKLNVMLLRFLGNITQLCFGIWKLCFGIWISVFREVLLYLIIQIGVRDIQVLVVIDLKWKLDNNSRNKPKISILYV